MRRVLIIMVLLTLQSRLEPEISVYMRFERKFLPPAVKWFCLMDYRKAKEGLREFMTVKEGAWEKSETSVYFGVR